MKRGLLISMAILMIGLAGYSQVSGTKTIPSAAFPTIASAIAEINSAGVGPGGVTFDVAANHTETLPAPSAGLLSTTTSSVTNPIVFQKIGAGANPIIKAATGTGDSDYIICISGTDYVTFNGIDIIENELNDSTNKQMEWGYAILKTSAELGSHHVRIENCNITLNKSNKSGYGIYMDNITLLEPASQLTITTEKGTNSNNKFYGINISNCYNGFFVRGYNDQTSPYTCYDQNNDFGSVAGNTVTNFAGGDQTFYGFNISGQNNITVANNLINGGDGTAAIEYGIYFGTSTNSNGSIYGNTITLISAGTTQNMYALYNAGFGNNGTSNILEIYNNTVTNCSYPGSTTSYFYGIYNAATAHTINVYGNTVDHNIIGGSGIYTWLLYSTSATGGTLHLYNNIVAFNQRSGAGTQSSTAYIYCLQIFGTGSIEAHDNQVHDNSCPGQITKSATIYGIYANNQAYSQHVYDNSVYNQSITSASSGLHELYGVYVYNTVVNFSRNKCYNNSVYNFTLTLTGTGYADMYGVRTYYVSEVSGNSIKNIKCTASNYGKGWGIHYGSGTDVGTYTGNIFNNEVSNISMPGQGGYYHGLYIYSGVTVYAYNNYIFDIQLPASTNNSSGIYVDGVTFAGLYHNTIYLDAESSSSTTFSISGVYTTVVPVVDLRNNIIVNTSKAPGSTTFIAATYRRSANTPGTYSAMSNNNDFYAGTPGPNNLIFYDGSNNLQTLASFKTFISPRDASSVSELPPFVNVATRPYNLHLQTSTASQCESAGTEVTIPVAITTDFDGDARYPNPGYPFNPAYPPTTTDIGADEFGGIPLDQTPPNINFTPLTNTSSTNVRTLMATIADPHGVPVSGAGLPVLYWKKNSVGSWKPSVANYLNGSNYSFTLGNDVALNDSVYYYIVAQDMWTPLPNIGSMPPTASGFTFDPPASGTPPTDATCYKYRIVGSLCGAYNVGAGQDYATITAAMADLLQKEALCPVIFNLTDATYPSETFPIVISEILRSSSAHTVTIKPADGANVTLAGLSASNAILKLSHANNIIIDGSNNGTSSRNLTIENQATSGTTAAIWVGSKGTGLGTSNITIKNCNIKNGYLTATSYGIFIGSNNSLGSSSPGDNNDSLTIQNNAISKAYIGIYNLASAAGANKNMEISGNSLGSGSSDQYLQNCGIYLSGASFPRVIGNEIFNLIGFVHATGIDLSSNVSGALISKNKIYDLHVNSTNRYANGISVGTVSGVNNATLTNNIIYNLTTANWSATSLTRNPFGINIVSGIGHKVYHNTVRMTGSQYAMGTAGTLSAALLITNNNLPGLDIRNNILINNLAGLAGSKSYCIYAPSGTTFGVIDNNNYYPSGDFGLFGFLGSQKNTLAEWQAATGQDTNSLSVDPVFVSPSDLHTNEPALNNSGVFIPDVTDDISGFLRTNPPDPGAYEFSLPVASISTLPATSIGQTSATLNGEINSSGEVVTLTFEYGTNTSYGNSANAVPNSLRSLGTLPFSADLAGLAPNMLYHYRAKGVSTTSAEVVYGADQTFLTISGVPVNNTIVNLTIASGTDTCFDATSTITIAGNNTTFVVQNGGSATMVAGEKILYLPGTQVEPGGYMLGYITQTNAFCNPVPGPTAPFQTGTVEGQAVSTGASFRIYPNPTTGSFTIVRTGTASPSEASLEIYGIHGNRVLTTRLPGSVKQVISLEGQPTGLYFIRVVSDGTSETVKLVKQ